MKKISLKISLILLLTLVCGTIQAQTQFVTAFKNGDAFMVKKEVIDASKGFYELKTIPKATFGSLWFNASNNSIKTIQTSQKEVVSKDVAISFNDILVSSINKKVKIYCDKNVFEGKLVSVTPSETPKMIFIPDDSREIVANPEKMVMLNTDGSKHIFLKMKDITFIETHEKTEVETKGMQKVIRIDFTQRNSSQPIETMYLSKGISWFPNYQLQIIDKNKAKLVLSAQLLNDAEDLQNAQMNFAVGIANFLYDNAPSPLVSDLSLDNFLSQLSGASSSGNRYNTLRNDNFANISQNTNYSSSSRETAIVMNDGQQGEDLFFYPASNINLKKGERATYPLFETQIDYENIYCVILNPNLENNSYSYRNNEITTRINLVQHSLQFQNQTKQPFTTGSVFITQKTAGVDRIVSQDRLNYTPTGGTTEVKLSLSSDILVKYVEKIIDEKVNFKKINSYNYNLITVEGKIEVKNYKNIAVKVQIKREVIGEMLKTNIDWKTTKKIDMYNVLNNRNDVEWKVDLEAGKSKEITYTYQIYVRE